MTDSKEQPCKIDPKKIADLTEIYLKHRGRNIRAIVREMHERGWTGFRASRLYDDRVRKSAGLIKRFGLAEMLSRKARSEVEMARARLGFQKWLAYSLRGFQWNKQFQRHIFEKLMTVTDGGVRRLMVFMPPRHGKSEMITIRYAAWRLLRDPSVNIVIGSYNQRLANRFALRIKRIVDAAGLRNPRPGADEDKPLNRVDEWETREGGGVKAVGVGAGITGFGADLVIIDDPVKSRAEAESTVRRETTWEWYNDDVYTRLEPRAAIILIQTRWHEDDLAGRLINAAGEGGEQWAIVSLPALAESKSDAFTRSGKSDAFTRFDEAADTPEDETAKAVTLTETAKAVTLAGDALGRAEGEALWPERYDAEYLKRVKRQLGSYSFSALYQQRPIPAEGAIFKRAWFNRVVSSAPSGLSWARGYDLAVSTRTTADYTASFRCAFDDKGNLYIADGFRARVEFPEQRRYVLERLAAEKNTMHGVEQALHGQAIVQEIRRDSSGRGAAIRAVRVDQDKLTRSLAWSSLAEDGKVILVRGPWIDEFITEACSFPNGRYDDQIDAVSLAVGLLKKRGAKLYAFS